MNKSYKQNNDSTLTPCKCRKKKCNDSFMRNYYDDEEEDGPHWTGF